MFDMYFVITSHAKRALKGSEFMILKGEFEREFQSGRLSLESAWFTSAQEQDFC